MDGGRIVDAALVGNALRQVLARAEITSTRALIAASDTIASFRVLTFPGGTSDADVDATVKGQLPSTHDRLAIRRVDVLRGGPERTVYATVWDRNQVRLIADAASHAGLEPAVVDLKSMCISRAVGQPNCLVIDMLSHPVEVILIVEHIPRVWHTFSTGTPDGDLAAALATGLKPVLTFDRKVRGSGVPAAFPIVIRSEQMLPGRMATRLEELSGGHPVQPVPAPPRVDPELRYTPYLACVGLVMRRRS